MAVTKRANKPKPFLSVDETADYLGISRGLAYMLVRRFLAGEPGGIPAYRMGPKRIVVPRAALERMANGDLPEPPPPPRSPR